MNSKQSQSQFLQRLGELYRIRRPGTKTSGPHELFLVDLSDWKLQLSDRTPLLWARAELVRNLSSEDLVEGLRDVARERGWLHRSCICVLDGDGSDLKVRLSDQHTPRFVILDADDQLGILGAHSFTAALQGSICAQIPISELAPYEISKPVTGSRFFDRESQIRRVIHRAHANFAVVGSRRIGKTSLLREVEHRLRLRGSGEASSIFLDCSLIRTPYAFVEALIQELYPSLHSRLTRQTPEVLLLGLLNSVHKLTGQPITIFLDEVDRWFAPSSRSQELLDMFRVSSESEYCRYIIAGFSELMREPQRVDSPFYRKTFEWIRLSPFSQGDVQDVVLTPMRILGVRFKDADEVVTRIHSETGGIPLLVQYYCLSLISEVDKAAVRVIGPDSLDEIPMKPGFRNHVVGPFRHSIDAEDRLLIYALLLARPSDLDVEPFTRQDMIAALRNIDIAAHQVNLDQSCDRLALAGILTRAEGEYRFLMPILPSILREDNLNHSVSEARMELGL